MKNSKFALAIFSICVLTFSGLSAQDTESTGDPFIDMMLGQVAFAGGRIVQLAEAIPADKYGWKASDEVRTTSEQIVHLLSSLYFIPGMMGAEKPESITRDLEKKLTDKEEVIKNLRESMDFASEFLKSYDTSNYDEIVKTPFGEFSQRFMILIINNHLHEHLGQLIVYARSNGVTPPWSMPQEEG